MRSLLFFLPAFLPSFFIYLFIYGCVGSLFLRAGFLQLWPSAGYFFLPCTGFSLQWPLFLTVKTKTILNSLKETVSLYEITSIFSYYLFMFVCLFMAVLGLRCSERTFSSCGERGLLFVAVCRLLIAVPSLVAEHGLQARRLQQLWNVASVVVAHGLSCSAACEIFPDQGQNPYPLHWQADS